ncbi:hypothetical protein [Achromobacter pestifer]
MSDQNNAAQAAEQDHIKALRDLQLGVEMDRLNLDDGQAKLDALAAAIDALSKLRAEGVQAGDEMAFQLIQDLHAFAAHQRWFGEHGYESVGASDRLEISNTLFARLRAALESAPVAGEAQPTDEQIHRLAFDAGVVFGNTEEGAECWEFESPSLREFALALLSRHAAPQASEAVCSCPSGDGSLRHPCAVHPPSDKDGGDCAKGAGDERDTGKDRLAFHIWALVRGMDITLNDSCGYQSPLTQRAWMRWNPTERAAPAAKKQDIPANLMERLRHHAADKSNTAFARSTMTELAGYLDPRHPRTDGGGHGS